MRSQFLVDRAESNCLCRSTFLSTLSKLSFCMTPHTLSNHLHIKFCPLLRVQDSDHLWF